MKVCSQNVTPNLTAWEYFESIALTLDPATHQTETKMPRIEETRLREPMIMVPVFKEPQKQQLDNFSRGMIQYMKTRYQLEEAWIKKGGKLKGAMCWLSKRVLFTAEPQPALLTALSGRQASWASLRSDFNSTGTDIVWNLRSALKKWRFQKDDRWKIYSTESHLFSSKAKGK